jgi:hypothetical protein
MAEVEVQVGTVAPLKEAIGALAKPSRGVYHRQAAIFGRLGLNEALNQIGFQAAPRTRNRNRCRIAAAQDAQESFSHSPTTAGAARKQTKPQSTSYHTSSATQQEPRARHRIRAYSL